VDSVQLDFTRFGQLEKREAPLSLHKEDQQYLRLITFDYLGSARFGSRHLNNCLDTLRAELPLGFTATRPTFSRDKVAVEWTRLTGLAVVLIFFICALLFESLSQALAIVLLIPFSFIGVFLTFYWFDIRLDQGGYTSFLLVTGLSVNGIILIVNAYNGLRKSAPELSGSQRYARAFASKFRPIFLTIVSTAAGLIPFLIGSEREVFWHGLAAGTIGGLTFSLLLLSVVCPLFFLRATETKQS
jgi:multidrug efflux pump subunit AcrB